MNLTDAFQVLWNGDLLHIGGSKFSACNSKNNNFTKNKFDDKIKWLKEARERIEKYEG